MNDLILSLHFDVSDCALNVLRIFENRIIDSENGSRLRAVIENMRSVGIMKF